MKQRTIAAIYLLFLVTGIVWAAGDAVTVRSVDNVPVLQLSLDGTKAGGAVNARGDASGFLKVNVAAGALNPPQASSLTTAKTVSVTNAATALVASNGSRHEVTIVNNDPTTDVYVGDASVVAGNAAAAHGGILLVHAGGSWTTKTYTGAIDAITASGTAIVSVLEQ